MEKDMDKITKKVEKQVKKIRRNDDVEKGIIALANRVIIINHDNATIKCNLWLLLIVTVDYIKLVFTFFYKLKLCTELGWTVFYVILLLHLQFKWVIFLI